MSNNIFNNDSEIKRFIKENYDIQVNSIRKMKLGTANLYNINNGEYVFKVFQEKYKPKNILHEVEVLNILDKNGIVVPKYVKTVSGQYYKEYNGLVSIIQKFINGITIDMNSGNKKMLLDLASCYGKIIKVLNSCDLEFTETNITDWYSDDTINKGIEKLSKLLKLAKIKNKNTVANELDTKINLLKEVKIKYNFDELSKLTVLKSHGDFNHLQCLYNNSNRIIAVLDFVSSSMMPVSWEIIRSYSYLDKDVINGQLNIENLKQYIKEVMKYIKLNKVDLEYMCLIYYVQLLTSSFGYKQYLEDENNQDLLKFAQFRTRLCIDLNKNMDYYKEELLKILN